MSTMRATTRILRFSGPTTRSLFGHRYQTAHTYQYRHNSNVASREDLTSRIIPTYELSSATFPLTAPFKPSSMPNVAPSARATERFAVRGNAIVTGGAGDLGFMACRALLEHGASGLMIFDLDEVSMANRVTALEKEFPDAKIAFSRVNVTDSEDVQRSVEATVQNLGSVDVLLSFAGVASCVHATDAPVAEWRRILDINATGSFLCAQAVANAQIKARKPASIVLTASISAHRVNHPQPQAAYNASKAAVKHMASSLAAEWARYGIRVNTISRKCPVPLITETLSAGEFFDSVICGI